MKVFHLSPVSLFSLADVPAFQSFGAFINSSEPWTSGNGAKEATFVTKAPRGPVGCRSLATTELWCYGIPAPTQAFETTPLPAANSQSVVPIPNFWESEGN